jgi:predicted nucleic acid-binding protein
LPGIILDTNVVSEPKRARPDANVVTWFERQAADQLYLTSTIIAELGSESRARNASGQRILGS